MSGSSSVLIKVAILAIIVMIMAALHNYNRRVNEKVTERFLMGAPLEQVDNSVQNLEAAARNTYYRPETDGAGAASRTFPKECFPKDTLTPQDLLPGKDSANSLFAQMNPLGQGDVANQNFLTAGYHIGINTVGQSLRNANLQLRSETPNPRTVISPWMQSTIEPDINRRPLEIGPC